MDPSWVSSLPESPAEIPFSSFCRLLERIGKQTKSKDKLALLEPLWAKYEHQNVYPLMRLLIPSFDMVRQVYGSKEAGIAKLYTLALGLSEKTSRDAQRLKDWKKPMPSANMIFGDFTTVLYDVLRPRCTTESTKTIDQVNQLLNEISKATDIESRKKLWMRIISDFSAREQMWLMRIILKELKIGLRQETVLKHFHPQAPEVYNSSADLNQVCEYVLDPKNKSHFLQIDLFKPVRVMLAAVVDWDKIIYAMKGVKFGIEIKFDGERIQIHKKGNELKFFTRNSKDFTNQHGYRDVIGPWICSNVKADTCILDGELVTWDPVAQSYGQFGSNRTVSLRQAASQSESQPLAVESNGSANQEQLCYIAFDILYLDGQILLEKPLHERRELLQGILKPVDNILEISESYQEATSTEEIMERLDVALDKKLEGLVIKNMESTYQPNERHGGWIKLKPEYVEGMSDTLDLVILGGYFGQGKRRSGKLSQFLLGVSEKPLDGGEPKKFFAFCKVGTGYSGTELDKLLEFLNPHWVRYSKDTDYDYLYKWKPSKDDAPDAMIDHPRNSVVLEILAGGITRNTKFNAGCTLRFPRTKAIRWTKSWYDCNTLNDVMEVLHKSDRMHIRGNKRARQESNRSNKKGSGVKRTKASLSELFMGANVEGISVENDLFQNLEFHVVCGNDSHSKHELETLIKKHGGEFVQNPVEDTTDFIVVGDLSLKAKNLIAAEIASVVDASWIIDSVEKGERQVLSPKYVKYLTSQMKTEVNKLIDPFGDSYQEDSTFDSLEKALTESEKSDQFTLINIHQHTDFLSRSLSLEQEESEAIQAAISGKAFR